MKDYQLEEDQLTAAKVYCSNLGEEPVKKINAIISRWKNECLEGKITHLQSEERQKKFYNALHFSKWAGDPINLQFMVNQVLRP